MIETTGNRLRFHLTHPALLLGHVVLRTEIHVCYAGLAFFALVAFYSDCLVLPVEAFVVLGGAYVAARPASAGLATGHESPVPDHGAARTCREGSRREG